MLPTSIQKERAYVMTKWADDKALAVMKQAKEEILTTAWKKAPYPETLQNYDQLDSLIRHYLNRHFNPRGKSTSPWTSKDAVAGLQTAAVRGKPGASITQKEIKAILLKHADAAPRP